MEIWINPACSKCRAATSALDEAGVPYTVRRYLEDPPTREELETVLARLGLEPWDITRLGEPEAGELGLPTLPRDAEHRARWLDALAGHPRLVQRPIVTADDGTAVVARDQAALDRLLP
jgi:arsenate reductase